MWLLSLSAAAQAVCGTNGGATCDTGLPSVSADSGSLSTILSIVIGTVAAVALLMIVIGAVRLAQSQGDANAAKQGRNTIIYALVGLVVAISAQLLVAFTLGRL